MYYQDTIQWDSPQEADLWFFAPELVVPKLRPGAEILISEGSRVVGKAQILQIYD
jgi:hypothetical protein